MSRRRHVRRLLGVPGGARPWTGTHRLSEGQEGARRAEERRVVTTLFCDLVGFTAISEHNDAELVDAMLRRYYAAARRVIASYGGTVEKYVGDAVVAVFGVLLHEDDPERAVRAGLRLVDEIDVLPGIAGQAVEVRVGINTGEALVRLGVDPASGEGFLTGDAVNVAARLQSAAPAMAVAVGESTHAATEKVFAFDVCHPVALKGKSRPLRAWIATAPKVRTGADLRSFATSFVGRDDELGALQASLHRADETGHAQLALVVGEPGIGKSRLLAEFARRLDDEAAPVTWRQGRCLPFGSNVTFWALSEIVRASAGVLESDGVARTEARLEAVLPEGPDCDRLRARLRPLLGLEAEEASREENYAAWRAFLEGQAAQGPAVLVVEDLHWADEPMLAFMDDLAQNLGDVPLLVLATGRQEVLEFAGSGAGFVVAAEQVALGPLSGDETGRARPLPPRREVPARPTSRPPCSSAAAATRSSPRSSCACWRTAACSRAVGARSPSSPAPSCPCPTRSVPSSPPASTCSPASARRCSLMPRWSAAASGRGPWPRSAGGSRQTCSWVCTNSSPRS